MAGRKTKEVLRNGSYWVTAYDDANRRVTNTFKNSANSVLAVKTTEFDRRGNLIRTVDELGNTFINIFDGLNRLRTAVGPQISFDLGTNAPPNPAGPPPPVQYVTTTYYDASGIITTNANALGEKVIETRDAIGRQTKLDIRDSLGQSIRVTSTSYFTNFHGAAITEGSGSDAITRYVLNDNQGRTVATVAYPSQYVMEYTLNNYDAVGNLLSATRYANNRGVITQWQAATNSYDELNRVSSRIEKDNATTAFSYDALGGLTNRVNPGGLVWRATYNNAGQTLQNWNVGTNNTTARQNTFTYYTSGNWIGLLSTVTDARNVVCAHSYDNWLRPSTKVYSGSLAEQQMTNTFAFDVRGLLTNVVEQFASSSTGPTVVVNRSYDAYGKLLDESTIVGGIAHNSAGQGWNSAGRRTSVAIGSHNVSFGSRADGLITTVASNDGTDTSYGYNTAGLLNNRNAESLAMTVTARDGVGRILGRTTTVNSSNRLVESMGWTDDGLLAAETAVRSGGPSDGNFTDNRSYGYSPLTRRLSQEKISMTSSSSLTTQFQYDKGATAGAGVLTTIADSQAGGANWNADVDEFRRVKQETNNVVRRFAYGRVNGSNQVASVSVFLDSKPLPVTTVGTTDPAWPLQWWAYLELLPSPHSLEARVTDASGTWTTNKTITFTTTNALDQTTLSYFSEGQVTQRVWKAASGAINRTQNLIWDGKGRLMKITERDVTTNGYDWTATYDAFGRRLQTVTSRVVQGTNLTAQPTVAKSYFDPEVEFLELGVSLNGKTSWKVYGPDANGRYGGLQGVGGLDAIIEDPGTVYLPIVDALGSILGHYAKTHSTNGWHSSRLIGYGAVSESRPLSLGESPNLSASAAWRGKTPDLSGFYWLGARYYDPVSGRFISCDPLGHDADASLYAFANGDPINHFDADGRLAKGVVNMGIDIANAGLFLPRVALYPVSYLLTEAGAKDPASVEELRDNPQGSGYMVSRNGLNNTKDYALENAQDLMDASQARGGSLVYSPTTVGAFPNNRFLNAIFGNKGVGILRDGLGALFNGLLGIPNTADFLAAKTLNGYITARPGEPVVLFNHSRGAAEGNALGALLPYGSKAQIDYVTFGGAGMAGTTGWRTQNHFVNTSDAVTYSGAGFGPFAPLYLSRNAIQPDFSIHFNWNAPRGNTFPYHNLESSYLTPENKSIIYDILHR